jgi:hypothetical protein
MSLAFKSTRMKALRMFYNLKFSSKFTLDLMGPCECFFPTLFEKNKQKYSQRVLELVAYEIYMLLNFSLPSNRTLNFLFILMFNFSNSSLILVVVPSIYKTFIVHKITPNMSHIIWCKNTILVCPSRC